MQWRRRSIRLKRRDYTRSSVYFVTICTWQRKLLFGRVVNGKMVLNDVGSVVANEWHRTAEIRPYVMLDAWVIMPNHIHAIVIIRNPSHPGRIRVGHLDAVRGERWDVDPGGNAADDDRGLADGDAPTDGPGASRHDAVTGRPHTHRHHSPTIERFGKPVAASLPTVIRSFKSAVTKRINEMRGTPGGMVWQRNYYESVLRTQSELVRIRRYIANNPEKWHRDRQNRQREPMNDRDHGQPMNDR